VFQLSRKLGVVAVGLASTTPGLIVGYSPLGLAAFGRAVVTGESAFLEGLFLFLLDGGESFDGSISCCVRGVVGSDGAEILISGMGLGLLSSVARLFLIGSEILLRLPESMVFSGTSVVVTRAGAAWNLWNF
jgi:hypothetical protein